MKKESKLETKNVFILIEDFTFVTTKHLEFIYNLLKQDKNNLLVLHNQPNEATLGYTSVELGAYIDILKTNDAYRDMVKYLFNNGNRIYNVSHEIDSYENFKNYLEDSYIKTNFNEKMVIDNGVPTLVYSTKGSIQSNRLKLFKLNFKVMHIPNSINAALQEDIANNLNMELYPIKDYNFMSSTDILEAYIEYGNKFNDIVEHTDLNYTDVSLFYKFKDMRMLLNSLYKDSPIWNFGLCIDNMDEITLDKFTSHVGLYAKYIKLFCFSAKYDDETAVKHFDELKATNKFDAYSDVTFVKSYRTDNVTLNLLEVIARHLLTKIYVANQVVTVNLTNPNAIYGSVELPMKIYNDVIVDINSFYNPTFRKVMDVNHCIKDFAFRNSIAKLTSSSYKDAYVYESYDGNYTFTIKRHYSGLGSEIVISHNNTIIRKLLVMDSIFRTHIDSLLDYDMEFTKKDHLATFDNEDNKYATWLSSDEHRQELFYKATTNVKFTNPALHELRTYFSKEVSNNRVCSKMRGNTEHVKIVSYVDEATLRPIIHGYKLDNESNMFINNSYKAVEYTLPNVIDLSIIVQFYEDLDRLDPTLVEKSYGLSDNIIASSTIIKDDDKTYKAISYNTETGTPILLSGSDSALVLPITKLR